MPETRQIPVIGMTCGGCEAAVSRVLGQVTGVMAVSASHRQGLVTVTFDPGTVEVDVLTRKIEALGYGVPSLS